MVQGWARAWVLVVAGTALLAAQAVAPGAASATTDSRPTPITVAISVSPAVAGESSSVLVRVSRGRIARIELRTDGQVTGRDWALQGRIAAGAITWRAAGARRVVAEVSLRTGRLVTGRLSVSVANPAPPTPVASPTTPSATTPVASSPSPAFALVYLYPAGSQPVAGRTDAIAHEALVVDSWYAGQLNGRSPRFAVDATGVPTVAVVPSDLDPAALAARADVVGELVAGWRSSGLISANAVPVVYVEGKQAKEMACGWTSHGRSTYIVVPMDNCDIHPQTDSRFPYGATYLLAHEMLHALGAVSDAAPHYDGTGHVNDDPRDLIYFGQTRRDWANLTIDPGHDDYYLTGRADLANIESSALLE